MVSQKMGLFKFQAFFNNKITLIIICRHCTLVNGFCIMMDVVPW